MFDVLLRKLWFLCFDSSYWTLWILMDSLLFHFFVFVNTVATLLWLSLFHLWFMLQLEVFFCCFFTETLAEEFENWFDDEKNFFCKNAPRFVVVKSALTKTCKNFWIFFEDIESVWWLVWGVFWYIFQKRQYCLNVGFPNVVCWPVSFHFNLFMAFSFVGFTQLLTVFWQFFSPGIGIWSRKTFFGKRAMIAFFAHAEQNEVSFTARLLTGLLKYFTYALSEKFFNGFAVAKIHWNAKLRKIPWKVKEYPSQLI